MKLVDLNFLSEIDVSRWSLRLEPARLHSLSFTFLRVSLNFFSSSSIWMWVIRPFLGKDVDLCAYEYDTEIGFYSLHQTHNVSSGNMGWSHGLVVKAEYSKVFFDPTWKIDFKNQQESQMVAKALDSQRQPFPLSMGVGKCDIERGRTPEEADDIYLNVAAKIHAIVQEC